MDSNVTDIADPIPDRPLPLGDWHIAQGARMTSFAGYVMPVQYEGVMAEHLWTRQQAGLFDISHMGQILLTGEDPDKAIEMVVPGDIQGLAVDRVRYTLLLDEEGGILDDLMITRRPRDLYLVVNGATKYDDLAYLRETLPDTVSITHLDERALFALQGPLAGAALAGLIPDVDQLYFMMAGSFTLDGRSLWISRSGYTGEDGFEISVDVDHAHWLADRLCALDPVKPVGLGARDSLRLEAGLPLYGHDLTPETSPVAADLNFAVAKRRREARDFAGADRVVEEYPDAAPMKRVALNIDGRQPVREGAEIVDSAGAVIGHVTSGGFSPSLQRPIAMAYLPRAAADIGAQVHLRQRGKAFTARVTGMPFLPHRYRRPPAKTA